MFRQAHCQYLRAILTFLSALSISFFSTENAQAVENKAVCASVVVNAAPAVVFDAIRGLRSSDAKHRKLLSYENNEAMIKEYFGGLPIIGSAFCIYKECEMDGKRIDYSLLNSDHFKMFEGSWILTPSPDGKTTTVELTSSLDPGLRIPFWKEITRSASLRHVKKRLNELMEYIENCQVKAATPTR